MKPREIEAALRKEGDPETARFLAKYFKTGPGEYAEGDVFVGLKVPQVRALAKTHKGQSLPVLESWLDSGVHEVRLLALIVLVNRYPRADDAEQEAIVKLYLRKRSRVNNWNLVDASASYILGGWLTSRDRKLLDELAESESLWDRRIAIVTTHRFIRQGEFGDTLRLAEKLLGDEESLLHKATGWMLREVGKRDLATLEKFLDKHTLTMPRTMLRYAIEHLPEKERLAYLKLK
jgi:3-methyladenine DNA glycosylase AlkD